MIEATLEMTNTLTGHVFKQLDVYIAESIEQLKTSLTKEFTSLDLSFKIIEVKEITLPFFTKGVFREEANG